MATTSAPPAPTVPRRARYTTVALKWAMAISGLLFVGFVLLHMYGNFKAFEGQESFDAYAESLRTLGTPVLPYYGFLWIQRVVLTVALVVHVVSAVMLWRRASKARPRAYVVKKRSAGTSYAARTMRWGGVILLLFIIFHILQFTTVSFEVGGSFDSEYDRLVAAFQPEAWWVYTFYFIANLALALHVRHGVFSALQTLSISDRRKQRLINILALLVALALFIGFMTPPTAMLFGIIS
ncbi:succinate dehydrogenase cytochrome b subunit [Bogoriella caseilytica]|uniref:Succinate dehydrogenase subunit C n=1 Tax=Bogoriella caseilytica TaxID=56055 RepID=A0A3N2BEB5_9MICO|nr:succinate dehydrogenase cytochrome b subunit [Bogoriella caseilytica]ROR73590.1 succinate dehydrogenase subunit C [Bogoriella caseilytica]